MHRIVTQLLGKYAAPAAKSVYKAYQKVVNKQAGQAAASAGGGGKQQEKEKEDSGQSGGFYSKFQEKVGVITGKPMSRDEALQILNIDEVAKVVD